MNRPDRLLLTPAEAADMIGIGRTKMYDLLNAGELPVIRIGRSVRIPVAKLRDWVDSKLAGNTFDGGR